MKKVINRGKRSKALSEVKPVKNISKNPLSFLEISPVQKEVLSSHKLQDHAVLENCVTQSYLVYILFIIWP